jgi:hypothetical protein
MTCAPGGGDQDAAGPQHAAELAERTLDVRYVVQHVQGQDTACGGIGNRQLLSIRDDIRTHPPSKVNTD